MGASAEEMINGTTDLEVEAIFKAIDDRANTSLTQAMATAEHSVGSNSFALAAFVADHDGYSIYTIILGAPGMECYYVTAHLGNGQMLAMEKVSQEELKRHQLHMAATGGGSLFLHWHTIGR